MVEVSLIVLVQSKTSTQEYYMESTIVSHGYAWV